MKSLQIILFLIPSLLFSQYAPNGGVFTPKGTLRALVICAEFEGYEDRQAYPCNAWNSDTTDFPDWALNKSVFFNDTSDFLTYSNQCNQNISDFFYQMSDSSFKMLVDVYPTVIKINYNVPLFDSIYNVHITNPLVLQKMRQQDSLFDWSHYDNRTNHSYNGYYLTDNSFTNPDSTVDYVIIVYRFNKSWYSGGSSVDGNSYLSGINSFAYNGFTINSDGFTMRTGDCFLFSVFVHELSHELFSPPHYTSQCNNVVGDYFYGNTSGWGMMKLDYTAPFASTLGWERWYLDWSPIMCNGVSSDITNPDTITGSQYYRLRDFIKYGDVVRIKIPNGSGQNQYLWLENHQGESIFDDRSTGSKDVGCSHLAVPPYPIPPSPRGLVAYLECINDNKNLSSEELIRIGLTKANGIKFITGSKRNDLIVTENIGSDSCFFWGKSCPEIQTGAENPISGFCKSDFLRFDIDNDNFINAARGSGSPPLQEWLWYLNDEGTLTQDYFFSGNIVPLPTQSFQNFNATTNPPLLNYPKFNTDMLTEIDSVYYNLYVPEEPYILNGINLRFLNYFSNGDAGISVSYSRIDVQEDLRWCGAFIHLPDITGNAEPDLYIQPTVTLHIDKSGTPNTNFNDVYSDFIHPTKFSVLTNATMTLAQNANVLVENGSELIIDSNATLNVDSNAVLYIKAGSKLTLKDGSIVHVQGNGKIIIECEGKLCVIGGASITLNDVESTILMLEDASLTCETTLFYYGSGKTYIYKLSPLEMDSYLYFDRLYLSRVVNSNANQTVITNNAKVKVWYNEECVILSNFTSGLGTELEIKPSPFQQYTCP